MTLSPKNTKVKCALFIATKNGKLGDMCEDIWHGRRETIRAASCLDKWPGNSAVALCGRHPTACRAGEDRGSRKLLAGRRRRHRTGGKGTATVNAARCHRRRCHSAAGGAGEDSGPCERLTAVALVGLLGSHNK